MSLDDTMSWCIHRSVLEKQLVSHSDCWHKMAVTSAVAGHTGDLGMPGCPKGNVHSLCSAKE